ncbi:hypothetical protein PBI_NESBITT_39 [Streptomyces phage Nesbitt]|uniref:Holliday junction resolvase n=1 Tax=Streptomyces phage Nesbitt TaxID=2108133 RepID=A0A2P1JT27_9CAUD|nr:hypothetical protein PBI_NESBITT_39 [Streptomyces phage Nesbitt]
MANPSKARGTAWESSIRDYLNTELGLYWPDWQERRRNGLTQWRDPMDPANIKRQAQEGAKDVGDIHAWPFILEAKDVKNPAVPTWMRQAKAEAFNAGFPYYVVVHKLRNANVRFGRVHMDVRTFTAVRRHLGLTAAQMWETFGFELSKPLRGLDTSRWYFTMNLWHFGVLLRSVRAASR